MTGFEAPVGDPRERLAAAMRPIIAMIVAAELDDAQVAEAAREVEAIAERLAARKGPGKRPRGQPDTNKPAQEFFPTSPIIGMANPVSPPVTLRVVDGEEGGFREIRAEVNFDYQYEGPPTCVHGGVIAETFDEVLGAAVIVAGLPGMTGTLTVRYRKPTPLRTDLRIVARCLSRDGRKVRAWAGMYQGELLTAEADGLFILIRPTQFIAIAEGNVDEADPVMLAMIRAEAAREGAAADLQGTFEVLEQPEE